MKGLEAIKDKILAQAAGQVKDIESSAEAQVSEILSAAKADAAGHLSAGEAFDEADKNAVLMRERSLVVSESRKVILSVKQELISSALEEAVRLLSEMDKEDKKELYLSVLKKNIKGGETVRFAAADILAAKELRTSSGLDFRIDDKPGDFSGGMIIYRDQTEINMTFEMIVRQNRTELVAIASSELFRNDK